MLCPLTCATPGSRFDVHFTSPLCSKRRRSRIREGWGMKVEDRRGPHPPTETDGTERVTLGVRVGMTDLSPANRCRGSRPLEVTMRIVGGETDTQTNLDREWEQGEGRPGPRTRPWVRRTDPELGGSSAYGRVGTQCGRGTRRPSPGGCLPSGRHMD